MIAAESPTVVKQHLIDPEICIRCNTCEATCPVGAITHDDNNYVVRADTCNGCMACISPCPTGSIDNWRTMPVARVYSIDEQFGWQELPTELTPQEIAAEVGEDVGDLSSVAQMAGGAAVDAGSVSTGYGSIRAPASAGVPRLNLFAPKEPAVATVVGNLNCTESGYASETHHIVLDFGSIEFPVLEGQSIGIIAPGLTESGQPHQPRQYSVASARNGERVGYNNLALTVKRVIEDHQGRPIKGVASNYVCDLKVGDQVKVVGPYGASFLMPNHAKSHIVMICTGTGSAPMRAMTECRRRLRKGGDFESGKLMLFFGARTPQELPYFGPLQSLPKDFIDINLAFSRLPNQPRRYVQDAMRDRAADLQALLSDPNTYFYVCGLKSMEEGVVLALREIARDAGLDWNVIGPQLKEEARLHFETY
jgi:benzoyl-CoA 2,3-dioxygenase component A